MNAMLQPPAITETPAFALTEALCDVPNVGPDHYHLAGLDWQHESNSVFGDSLAHCRPQTHEILRILADEGDRWNWSWTRVLTTADGVESSVFYCASENTLAAAANAAAQFAPFTLPKHPHWIGIPSANGGDWQAIIDGDRASIWRQTDGTYWWRRRHPPADPIAQLFGTAPLQGETTDLDSAISACERSVADLLAATARFISALAARQSAQLAPVATEEELLP